MTKHRSRLLWSCAGLMMVLLSNPAFAAPPIREAPRPLDAGQVEIGRQIPDVTFTGLNRRPQTLSEYAAGQPLVVFMTNTGCPLCRRYAPTLAALEKEYQDNGVRFLFVNPNAAEKQKRIDAAIRTQGFQAPYVRDTQHSLIRALKAKTTTEVFVLDGDRRLVYRGAVSDQYGFGYSRNKPRHTYLRDALAALAQGKAPLVAATTAPGCELWIDDDEAELNAPQ